MPFLLTKYQNQILYFMRKNILNERYKSQNHTAILYYLIAK